MLHPPSPTASIVTWNVNSLRSRLSHVLDFLRRHTPDIVLLQELKLEETKFPYAELEECGYQCAVYGQKTYNGVAILSREPLEDVTRHFDADDDHARYIEAVTCAQGQVIRVASVYVPNGQEVGSDKFAYKLAFLEKLRQHCATLLEYNEWLVVGGDYNVAPLPQDVYDAESMEGTLCYHPDERSRLRALLHLGLYDAYRVLHPEQPAYSWWDYRGGSLERDHGMRIDHLLLSPEVIDRLADCHILKDERFKDKPSDHAPVMAKFRTKAQP
jgi:exodeoxyribonuclease III